MQYISLWLITIDTLVEALAREKVDKDWNK